jgi:hypothetical protein
MKMTAVSIVWAEQQEAQVYLSGADPLTYPTESVVTGAGATLEQSPCRGLLRLRIADKPQRSAQPDSIEL